MDGIAWSTILTLGSQLAPGGLMLLERGSNWARLRRKKGALGGQRWFQ